MVDMRAQGPGGTGSGGPGDGRGGTAPVRRPRSGGYRIERGPQAPRQQAQDWRYPQFDEHEPGWAEEDQSRAPFDPAQAWHGTAHETDFPLEWSEQHAVPRQHRPQFEPQSEPQSGPQPASAQEYAPQQRRPRMAADVHADAVNRAWEAAPPPADPRYAGQYGAGQYGDDQSWAEEHWRAAAWPQEIWAEAQAEAAAAPQAGRAQRLVNSAGALTSLALIAGLAFWGYKLAVRDMTGIPVIQAMAGPARVAPEDPGGELAVNTGFSVNELSADGVAAPVGDQLQLAPPPVSLSPEDETMGALNGAASRNAPRGEVDPVDPDALKPGARPEPLPDDSTAQSLEGADPSAIDALVAQAVATVPDSVPGVKRSPRPPMKPGAMLVPTPADLPPVRDIDPASLKAGTRLVQLGAFDSAATARSEWERIALEYPPLMKDKGRVIQKAESGGKTFYRLRAEGFSDVADARRFCAAIVRPDMRCIPVQVR